MVCSGTALLDLRDALHALVMWWSHFCFSALPIAIVVLSVMWSGSPYHLSGASVLSLLSPSGVMSCSSGLFLARCGQPSEPAQVPGELLPRCCGAQAGAPLLTVTAVLRVKPLVMPDGS